MLASSAEDRGFELRSDQTKYMYFKSGICCFTTKDAELISKNNYWLARNHDNVYAWSDKSFYRHISKYSVISSQCQLYAYINQDLINQFIRINNIQVVTRVVLLM